MGPTEWRLAATAMTMLALALTGCQLVRSIWMGRPVGVRRYRSVLVVELAAGALLSLPGDRPDDTVVAGTIETAPCLGSAGVAALNAHGERLTIEGVGRPAPTCAIWAVIEDTSGGGTWLQGPAVQRDAGWDLDLVIGPGDSAAETLTYTVSLIAVDTRIHESWQGYALTGGPVRLQSYSGTRLAQRRFELRQAGGVGSLAELAVAR